MRWEDERYVRAYVRDTPEWCALSWEARALFWELLRKVDLAGYIAMGRAGLRGLAVLVHMPTEVVERALHGEDGLIADGCVVAVDGGFFMPNYVTAQQAKHSDKLRKQEQRARDSARMAGRDVTPGDQTGQSVTLRDDPSPNVTKSHAPSQPVTFGHSEPIRAERSEALSISGNSSLPPPPENPRPAPAAAAVVGRREPESAPSPSAGLAEAIGRELERHRHTRGLDAAAVGLLALRAFERKLGPAGAADGIAWAAEKLETESTVRAGGAPLLPERVIAAVISGFKGAATKRDGKPDERPAPPVKPKRKDLEPVRQPTAEEIAASAKAARDLIGKIGNGAAHG